MRFLNVILMMIIFLSCNKGKDLSLLRNVVTPENKNTQKPSLNLNRITEKAKEALQFVKIKN